MEFKKYSIELGKDYFEVYTDQEMWFRLPIESAIDTMDIEDHDDPDHLYRKEEKTDYGYCVTWETKSNLWEYKQYIVEFHDDFFYYRMKIRGNGCLKGIRFFSGPSRQYESYGYLFPDANQSDYIRNLRLMTEGSSLRMNLLSPPPLVYPFYMSNYDKWFGLGVVAMPGNYNFDLFSYTPGSPQFFELPLYGRYNVQDCWESQGIVGCPGNDAFDVIANYAEWHYQHGGCQRPDFSDIPKWWKGPIFCGWGEQGTMRQQGKYPNIFAAATQETYTHISRKLDENGLNASFLIIDDKWQETYGSLLPDKTKWPDLRAFADAEHAKGRKVVLWFKNWNMEGLPEDECALSYNNPYTADPTNDKYVERLKKAIYTLFSSDEGCYDCDGFKMDFTSCMPLGYGVWPRKPIYGIEMLKLYFKIVYETAKSVKPDAIINSSCCHPYFSDVIDQARLHDYNGNLRCATELMNYRQKLFRAVFPGISIDTDAGSPASRRDFMRYLQEQPKIGVPDLYYISELEKAPYSKKDLETLKEIWDAYIATL